MGSLLGLLWPFSKTNPTNLRYILVVTNNGIVEGSQPGRKYEKVSSWSLDYHLPQQHSE